MHRLLILLALATVALASRTIYYSHPLDPTPSGCTVYSQRFTVCHLDDDLAPAPAPGGHDAVDQPLIASTDAEDADVISKAVAQSWGQDRVDQRELPLNKQYNPDRTGNGATIWVVSSGIDATVGEVSGRTTNPFSASDPRTDCDGQGTEVAVTAAGATFGVASAAFLRGVKVLNCNGNGGTGDLVDGLTYILENPQSRNVVLIAVSYVGRNSAVEAVIEDLLAAGMTVVAEAGDQSTSACQFFPGAQDGVISVTSTTRGDSRYSFANYGSCVTMFAPGSKITTMTVGGTPVNRTGTRMAAAHVAGAAAQVLQGNPAFTSVQVLENLMDRATLNEIGSASGTPNALLFVLQNSNPPQGTTSTGTTTGSGASTLAMNVALAIGVALALL